MAHRTQWWSCPHCELACMADEPRCGNCGHVQRDDEDRGALTFFQLAEFVADAVVFKRPRRRKT